MNSIYGIQSLVTRDKGHQVNHKRVVRLMRFIELQAITPGPHTSKPAPVAPQNVKLFLSKP